MIGGIGLAADELADGQRTLEAGEVVAEPCGKACLIEPVAPDRRARAGPVTSLRDDAHQSPYFAGNPRRFEMLCFCMLDEPPTIGMQTMSRT